MMILPKLRIIDLSLYLEECDALVIGDVHLGFEESLNKEGILIPRFQYKDTLERMQKILSEFKNKIIKEIIINGDLKHEFGEISEQEWREILKFIDFLKEHCEKLVLVKGNHDVILYPIARKRGIEVCESYFLDGVYVCHGHNIDERSLLKAKVILVGDQHPAVTLRHGARSELFKCFLKGKLKGKDLIVMPSFNQVTIGTDVLRERSGEFGDMNDFEAFVIGDKIYNFGKLRDIK